MKKLLFLIMMMFMLFGAIKAANNGIHQNIRTLEPAKASAPPVLDGSLDDEVWKSAAMVDDLAAQRDRRTLLPDASELLFQGELPLPVLNGKI
jgi:hypothetical protein